MMGLTGAGINSLIIIQMACLIHADCVIRAKKKKGRGVFGIAEIVLDSHSTSCWSCSQLILGTCEGNAAAHSPSLLFTLFSGHFISSLSLPHFLFITLIFTLTPPLTHVVFFAHPISPCRNHTTIAMTVKVFSQLIFFFSPTHSFFSYPPLTFSFIIHI